MIALGRKAKAAPACGDPTSAHSGRLSHDIAPVGHSELKVGIEGPRSRFISNWLRWWKLSECVEVLSRKWSK